MEMLITLSAVTIFSVAFALLLECALLKGLFYLLSSVRQTPTTPPAGQAVLTSRIMRRSTQS